MASKWLGAEGGAAFGFSSLEDESLASLTVDQVWLDSSFAVATTSVLCFVKLLLVAVAVVVAAAVAVKAVVGECKQLHHENSGHCMEADSCAGVEFWRMLASHSSLAGSACASGRTKKRTLFVTRRLALPVVPHRLCLTWNCTHKRQCSRALLAR